MALPYDVSGAPRNAGCVARSQLKRERARAPADVSGMSAAARAEAAAWASAPSARIQRRRAGDHSGSRLQKKKGSLGPLRKHRSDYTQAQIVDMERTDMKREQLGRRAEE